MQTQNLDFKDPHEALEAYKQRTSADESRKMMLYADELYAAVKSLPAQMQGDEYAIRASMMQRFREFEDKDPVSFYAICSTNREYLYPKIKSFALLRYRMVSEDLTVNETLVEMNKDAHAS